MADSIEECPAKRAILTCWLNPPRAVVLDLFYSVRIGLRTAKLLGEIPRTQGQRLSPGNGILRVAALLRNDGIVFSFPELIWQCKSVSRPRHTAAVRAKLCCHYVQVATERGQNKFKKKNDLRTTLPR